MVKGGWQQKYHEDRKLKQQYSLETMSTKHHSYKKWPPDLIWQKRNGHTGSQPPNKVRCMAHTTWDKQILTTNI